MLILERFFLITAWKLKKMDIQKKKKRESNPGVIKVSHVSNDPSSQDREKGIHNYKVELMI